MMARGCGCRSVLAAEGDVKPDLPPGPVLVGPAQFGVAPTLLLPAANLTAVDPKRPVAIVAANVGYRESTGPPSGWPVTGESSHKLLCRQVGRGGGGTSGRVNEHGWSMRSSS